jgi:hypothetical protein
LGVYDSYAYRDKESCGVFCAFSFSIEEISHSTTTAKDITHAHCKIERKFKEPCGGKTIEHGTFMSEETMELMKKYDSYLVPSAGKK